MANNLSNVREFVIDSLKKYHQMLTAAEESALTTTLSDFVSKEYAGSTYLTKQDAAAAYITYEYAGSTYIAKETGKGLSTNDFTTAYMTKLDGIEDHAQVNVNADWDATSGDAQILHKPNIAGLFGYAYYDTTNHRISFSYSSNSAELYNIDCSSFIVDGMIDNVSIEQYSEAEQAANGTSYLFINFNTAAEEGGHTDIKIPLQNIFDPNNYYTKSEIDTTLSTTYLTKADAGTTYLSKEDAASTYLTKADAGNTYVAKETGKGLSEANFTATEKTKLSGIAEGAQVNVIESVSVDGTALPITAKGVNIDLSGKVDKVEGKGLSEADFTSTEKTKLAGIAEGAQVNVIESVKVNGTAQTVTNKAVDITVPTKLTDLTNDGNFVTDTNYVHTDNNYTTDEKTKLNGIQAGAQVNTIESVKVNGTALTPDANKAVNITVPEVPEIEFSSNSKPADAGDYTYVANVFSATEHEITVSYTGVLKSHQDISGKEDTSNKKTDLSVAANISDTYYPTTSAVTTYIGSIAELSTSELNSIFAE